jgi:tetratricopeptide (TPR) repeat protein
MEMVNYYSILKVSQSASVDDVKNAINRELRLWSNRTNAPQIERRQEAERMVKLLEEAESILLNENKRSEYNKKLATAPSEERKIDDQDIAGKEDLVKEGWRLLINDNVADALFVATKATEVDGKNPDAWALLAQAKFRWGDIEDAIYEYKRAINLKPNDAEFYFDLGSVYESAERWDEALQQYQRASQIDPKETMYKASIGILFVKNDMFKEGIDILENCVEEKPDNTTYQWFLAIAYAESTYQNWTYVRDENAFFATQKSHVEEAENYIKKAESLNFDDSELTAHIRSVKDNIQTNYNRKFHGNKLVLGAAGLFGILGLFMAADQGAEGLVMAAAFIGMAVLYYFSCLVPQYILNRRVISGKGGTGSGDFLAHMGSGEGGCFGLIIGTVIVVSFLPFIIIYNFIKNYAVSK